MAVVAAFKLDNFVAAGVAARQANGAHRRFSTGTDHAQALDRRHHRRDPGSYLRLENARRTETQPLPGGIDNRVNDGWMCMAKYHRAP
jgi:hypothetical protein